MKKQSKILELNSEHTEVALLSELSHEVSNFKVGFKGKLNHTFVLGPWASSLFGFEIQNGQAYIGVPEKLYSLFAESKFYLLNYIKGQPGIFLVFNFGRESFKRPVALRIFMREERVKALSQFKEVTFIKMSSEGEADPGYEEDEFTLYVKEVNGLDWENFGKKRKK